MKLSADQASATTEIRHWLNSRRSELAVGGLAGTGKTTIVGALAKPGKPLASAVFLAPTGKAARALQLKGVKAATIHSYTYQFNGWRFCDHKGVHDPKFKPKDHGIDREGDVLVIDEASMVSGDVARELRRLGKRILWVGDHGQLPPVGEDPKIMTNPRIRLETIHRQLAGSPILKLAYAVRGGKDPAAFRTVTDTLEVSKFSGTKAHALVKALIEDSFQQVIVPVHTIRVAINNAYRDVLGFDGLVEEGDRLVCLRNNRDEGLLNGMLFRVTKVRSKRSKHHIVVNLESLDDGKPRTGVYVWRTSLGQRYAELKDLPEGVNAFDYGYALTCHKAQGSEWESVAVIEGSHLPRAWDSKRWRYTAYTRAKSRLCVLLGRIQP